MTSKIKTKEIIKATTDSMTGQHRRIVREDAAGDGMFCVVSAGRVWRHADSGRIRLYQRLEDARQAVRSFHKQFHGVAQIAVGVGRG